MEATSVTLTERQLRLIHQMLTREVVDCVINRADHAIQEDVAELFGLIEGVLDGGDA